MPEHQRVLDDQNDVKSKFVLILIYINIALTARIFDNVIIVTLIYTIFH